MTNRTHLKIFALIGRYLPGGRRRSASNATPAGNYGGNLAGTVSASATIHQRCAAFGRNTPNLLRGFEPFPQYPVGRPYVNLEGPSWFRIGSSSAHCSSLLGLWDCSYAPHPSTMHRLAAVRAEKTNPHANPKFAFLAGAPRRGWPQSGVPT